MAAHTSDIDTDQTRTETVLAAHECSWDCDPDRETNRGRCRCGFVAADEEHWAKHATDAIVAEIWTAQAPFITSARALVELPERSTILINPGSEHAALYRRLGVGSPDMSIWVSLLGKMRDVTSLSAVLLLERGPDGSHGREIGAPAVDDQDT